MIGPLDLASGTAGDASDMYARNVSALVEHLTRHGDLVVDLDDEITGAACVVRGREIVSEQVRAALEGSS